MTNTTKNTAEITIKSKTDHDQERNELTLKARTVAEQLDKMPNDGYKVAGYLAAHGSLAKGNYTSTKNPVARFLSHVSPFTFGLPADYKLRVLSGVVNKVVLENDKFQAEIPIKTGVREFLGQFHSGYHGELYADA